MPILRSVVRPAAWFFYIVIVFEILFMISPFALHFYATYGTALSFLHISPYTAWLTQFFLPHFSQTGNRFLDAIPRVGGALIVAGAVMFIAAALPLYLSKLFRGGVVTGGLYRLIRHPQYAALAIVGLGTLLVWPRYLVLISYVTMLFLYLALARWEEARCLERYGGDYELYRRRTGRFVPQFLSRRMPRLPEPGATRVMAVTARYLVVVALLVLLAFEVQDFSLRHTLTLDGAGEVVLSPARLNESELRAAYELAASDERVRKTLRSATRPQIIYVLPEEWQVPDLPLEEPIPGGGHRTPADFDRTHFKVLFTRARTHWPETSGKEILRRAYGKEALLVARVSLRENRVVGVEKPPPHARWGDIPTPLF